MAIPRIDHVYVVINKHDNSKKKKQFVFVLGADFVIPAAQGQPSSTLKIERAIGAIWTLLENEVVIEASSTGLLVGWLRYEKKGTDAPSPKEADDTRGTEELTFTVTNPGTGGGSSPPKKVDVPVVNMDPD